MFAFFKRKKDRAFAVARLYVSIVEQSRQPVFYEQYGVPDTATGRFDLICLHAFLAMNRFHGEGRCGERMAQALFDRMFRNMDRSLREMGVGDLGVPKHMKRMMKGFNGRARSYSKAMRAGDSSELVEALRRNLYGAAVEGQEDAAKIMALYMLESAACLKMQPWDSLDQGLIEFKMIKSEIEDDREYPAGMVA